MQETLSRYPDQGLELISYPGQSFSLPIPMHATTYTIKKSIFNQLDLFNTNFPLLVVHAPNFLTLDIQQPPKGVELFCPLGDPSNVGALIRTCLGFGVNKLVLLEEAAHPFHPKSLRSASGAIFDQPLYQGPSLQALTTVNIAQSIIALDFEGKALSQFSWPLNVRLLVGEEGSGQSHYSFGEKLSIPMAQRANSLNATIAASIALYAYRLQHPF